MAQQTINVGTSPNDGTGTPLRTAFQYTNSNFSELYTAVGPSGNNIVVPGTATITGALTVGNGTSATQTFSGVTNILDIGYGSLRGGSAYGDVRLWTDRFRIYNNAGTQIIKNISGTNGDETWYDGAGGTRMTLNSTGLGVGVAPATNSALTIYKQNSSSILKVTNGPSANNCGITLESTGGNVVLNNGNGPFELSVGGSLRATVDTSGNVGVGVTPSAINTGRGIEVGAVGNGLWCNNSTYNQLLQNAYYNSGFKYAAAASTAAARLELSGGFNFFIAPAGTAGNAITFTQAMTLDASGNLLVGTTGTSWQTVAGFYYFAGSSLNVTRDGNACQLLNRLTSDGIIVDLRRSANAVGNISVTTTGATFNSTSDYRLKESVAPLSDGLARVNALKPSVYKWKSNGSDGEGFLAHELAEVVPAAVNGEKDAVNEDGTIKAQSIDMSRIVPILVAAIKELSAEVNALKNA